MSIDLYFSNTALYQILLKSLGRGVAALKKGT